MINIEEIEKQLKRIDSLNIPNVFYATLRRYQELFPDWEITTVSIERSEDRNTQIDNLVRCIEKLKEFN